MDDDHIHLENTLVIKVFVKDCGIRQIKPSQLLQNYVPYW